MNAEPSVTEIPLPAGMPDTVDHDGGDFDENNHRWLTSSRTGDYAEASFTGGRAPLVHSGSFGITAPPPDVHKITAAGAPLSAHPTLSAYPGALRAPRSPPSPAIVTR